MQLAQGTGNNHGRGHGSDHDHHHEPKCWQEQVAIYGQEYVEQTNRATDKDVSIKFLDSSTNEQVAAFNGSYRLQTDVVSSRVMSPCR